MKQGKQTEAGLDTHLQDIKDGSDAARAFQILANVCALIIVIVAGVDLFTEFSKQGWWAIVQVAIPFYLVGVVLGFVRTTTITIANIVEELRTTV